MDYADMLKQGIANRKLSLTQLMFRLAGRNIRMDKALLSKLQNGKVPPAKDEINIALAEALGIDAVEFRLAAVRRAVGKELFELIRSGGRESETGEQREKRT